MGSAIQRLSNKSFLHASLRSLQRNYRGDMRLETRKHQKQPKRCSSTDNQIKLPLRQHQLSTRDALSDPSFNRYLATHAPSSARPTLIINLPKMRSVTSPQSTADLAPITHPAPCVSKSLSITTALDASFGGVGAKLAYAADLRIHRFVLWRVGPRGQLGHRPRRCRIMHQGSPRSDSSELCPDSWAQSERQRVFSHQCYKYSIGDGILMTLVTPPYSGHSKCKRTSCIVCT